MRLLQRFRAHGRQLALLGFWVSASAVVEICGFNFQAVKSSFLHDTRRYSVADAALYEFQLKDGELVSSGQDPNITIANLGIPVRTISLTCRNSVARARGQIFWRTGNEPFSESRSFQYPTQLQSYTETVSLPHAQVLSAVRFDLTNVPGDTVVCMDFVINPQVRLNLDPARMAIYVVVILVSVLGLLRDTNSIRSIVHRISSELDTVLDSTMSDILHEPTTWMLCVVLAAADLSYPLLLSYDSSLFLKLAEEIHRGAWSDWLPVRLIVFPLWLEIAKSVFGANRNALLMPMTLAHLMLLVMCSYFVLESAHIKGRVARQLTLVATFLFIAIDPLIMGFYHTVLTEFLAATVAVVSCYGAYQLYRYLTHSPIPSQLPLFWTGFFVFMVPASWHLKQPYVGIAYFPFVASCLLMMLHRSTKFVLVYVLVSNALVSSALAGSIVAWNGFLATQRVADPARWFNSRAQISLGITTESIGRSPVAFGSYLADQYLVESNFFLRNRAAPEPSITRADQSFRYGTRMFFTDIGANAGYVILDDASGSFAPYTAFLTTKGYSPRWFSDIQASMAIKSYAAFTLTYLLLPLTLLVAAISWRKRKGAGTTIVILLAAASFLNALLHLFVHPIDRYLWWGYPLNLTICIIIAIDVFRRLGSVWQRHVSPRLRA